MPSAILLLLVFKSRKMKASGKNFKMFGVPAMINRDKKIWVVDAWRRARRVSMRFKKAEFLRKVSDFKLSYWQKQVFVVWRRAIRCSIRQGPYFPVLYITIMCTHPAHVWLAHRWHTQKMRFIKLPFFRVSSNFRKDFLLVKSLSNCFRVQVRSWSYNQLQCWQPKFGNP